MRTEDFIIAEKERQDSAVELIASENFVSSRVMAAVGSCLTNKYAEGYPRRRYYGGCEEVDRLEEYCQQQWKKVFQTDYYCNVQPHSGSQANMAAIMAVCQPGDTILSMSLNDGGHLTHGSPASFSGKLYNIYHYGVKDDGYIDFDDVRKKMSVLKPRLLVVGASAYPREIPYDMFAQIRNECSYDTIILADMAHVAGLVAAGIHKSPFGYADIVTTTTHKTLRGTRGGLVFCREELARKIDSAVFPGVQGGPLMHIIAGKSVTAEEAQEHSFAEYICRTVANAKAMAEKFTDLGMSVVSGGTDNHMFLLDLSKSHPHVTGKQAQDALDRIDITLNKNMIHNDERKPSECSGLRIGTAAMTTKGFTAADFCKIASIIKDVLDRLEKENEEKERPVRA